MRIYTIEGKQYAAIGEEVYVRLDADHTEVEEVNSATAARAKTTTTKKARGVTKVSGGRAVRKCSQCGKPGHIARKCPDGQANHAVEAPADQPSGKFVGTMDELKKRVNEIRAEHKGITSLRVAQMLSVRIETLNKVWEAELDGEDEDEGRIALTSTWDVLGIIRGGIPGSVLYNTVHSPAPI